jgi:hypothetical protein
MNTFRKRLTEIEEQKALRDYIEGQREMDGRSQGELEFLAVYGYFPEALEAEIPERQEFTVAGIRIVITAESVLAQREMEKRRSPLG